MHIRIGCVHGLLMRDYSRPLRDDSHANLMRLHTAYAPDAPDTQDAACAKDVLDAPDAIADAAPK